MKQSRTGFWASLFLFVLCIVGMSVCAQGCGGTFEEAKFSGHQAGLTAAPVPPSARCVALDDRHAAWGAVAKGSAVLAGASGLATIPSYGDQAARIGIASGVVAAGAVAAAAVFVSEQAATTWARECAQ